MHILHIDEGNLLQLRSSSDIKILLKRKGYISSLATHISAACFSTPHMTALTRDDRIQRKPDAKYVLPKPGQDTVGNPLKMNGRPLISLIALRSVSPTGCGRSRT